YWQADGTIVYSGRKDDQVKVRGYRIELSEIERALELHEHINTAVVIVHTDEAGDQQLVAYITGSDELNAGGIRNWLNAMLPAYMIPDRFIQPEKLSLNASGKVDRRALPLPGALDMNSGKEYIAPRNQIESKLAQIWSEVLSI
ncbi:amino acid adenylation domain-containing protein, partial [Niastella koreensis]